jgi:hypothetical protein
MPTFTVARNDKTSFYEVHRQGCFHLKAKHMEVMSGTYEAETGQAVAVQGETGNEGCFYRLGPCAKVGAVNEAARLQEQKVAMERYFDGY